MTTLVVTGATGFIGEKLVEVALARGWQVRALVRDPSRVRKAERLEFAYWDASASAPTPAVLAGADCLCHVAAFIPPDYDDMAYAETCFRVNALGTLSLLAAATDANVARLVYFSSGNAYARANRLAREDDPLYPATRAPYYLMSKVSGEVFVDHWRRTRGLSACILRLASVYGPGMQRSGLVPTVAHRLRLGERVSIRHGGLYSVDLVFVEDVVNAALAAVESSVTGPINIGSGRSTSARELAQMLVAIIGAEPGLVTIEEAQGEAQDLGFAALDIARARAQFGYRPTPLREGLQCYVDWLA